MSSSARRALLRFRLFTALFGGVLAGACGGSEQASDCKRRSDDRSDSTVDWSAAELAVVAQTNARRAEGGCCGDLGCYPPSPPLVPDENLHAAASAFATDMAEHSYLSHQSESGDDPAERAYDSGVRACMIAENVARGQPSPEAVVSVWMESDEHCSNLLWGRMVHIGVGHARSEDEFLDYWVQDFSD